MNRLPLLAVALPATDHIRCADEGDDLARCALRRVDEGHRIVVELEHVARALDLHPDALLAYRKASLARLQPASR